jgi:hypothetical protein
MGVWIGTMGVKGGVQWWYKKEPVFWLPAGTFPYWVEYIVAFPKAPKGMFILSRGLGRGLILRFLGSVSTMVFGMCATRVIGFVIGFVKDIVASRKVVEVSNTNGENVAGPKIEEVTTEKKTI